MTFTVLSLQQALGTFLFFFLGAVGWHLGAWTTGKVLR